VECLETFFNTWGSFTFRLHFFSLLSRYSRMSERVQHDEQCSSLHDMWRFCYDERCSSLHAEGLNDSRRKGPIYIPMNQWVEKVNGVEYGRKLLYFAAVSGRYFVHKLIFIFELLVMDSNPMSLIFWISLPYLPFCITRWRKCPWTRAERVDTSTFSKHLFYYARNWQLNHTYSVYPLRHARTAAMLKDMRKETPCTYLTSTLSCIYSLSSADRSSFVVGASNAWNWLKPRNQQN